MAAKRNRKNPAAKAKRSTSAARAGGAGRARPRVKPLSAATLKQFREILLAHKERISGDYVSLRQSHLRSSHRDSTGDLSGYSMHMADIGTDTFDREFGLAMASTEQDMLYRIDQALRRIDEKTYGVCESCGKGIKMQRLKAVPWARLCIKCKELEEKRGGEL